MSDFAFPPPATPSVAVAAADERFPVHRIYCVGLNYADHIREMGADPEAPPLFFMKPADALLANGAAIRPAAQGHLSRGRIWLTVNGERRQESDLSTMVWDVPHIIAALSRLYELRPGDLIFTGTPSGVGPLKPGDRLEGGIEGLEVLRNRIGPAQAA